MRVGVSSLHFVSATSPSSGAGLFTLFPCFSVRTFPRDRVLHTLLQCEPFPQAAVLHKLLQRRYFPWGAVFQEQASPVWVSYGVTNPASKPAPAWVPLSTGPQVLLGPQTPLDIYLLWHEVLHGLQVDICSTVDLHELQEDSLPHHGLLHGLQGNLCSGTWSTSSPSFFTALGVCRIVSLT